jgi:hypothetical protein
MRAPCGKLTFTLLSTRQGYPARGGFAEGVTPELTSVAMLRWA